MSNTTQELSQQKLTQGGFTNFDGLAQPIDYCYLVDGIEEILTIAARYDYDVDFSLDSVLEFVKFEFTRVHNNSSVPEDVIDFVRRQEYAQYDVAVVEYLMSDTFKNLLLTSKDEAWKLFESYTRKYFVPQRIIDDLVLTVAKSNPTDLTLGHNMIHGVNTAKLIREIKNLSGMEMSSQHRLIEIVENYQNGEEY
jgi:hypothetical protein